MSETPLAPENCQTMEEVRHGVDTLDAEIMSLIHRRFGYMRAAARIKPERRLVRDEARKAQVVAQVRTLAVAWDLPVEALGDIWDRLVETSIAYELEYWDAKHHS
ncbi:MAG TPA: chorismate mutase [Novosphingobium sp.]|nr:chorismate mutase [Novosphingobium sp.]